MAEETQSGTTPEKQTPPATQGKEQFSREYVHELREENKSWRVKAQDLEKQMESTKSESASKLAESAKAVESAKKSADERILRAELKASAIKSGMIDLEFLKLVDMSEVSLSEDGEVKGAEELMESLKKNKPHFFQENKSSSSTHKTPEKKSDQPKSAKEMTAEEYAKEKARLTKSRR